MKEISQSFILETIFENSKIRIYEKKNNFLPYFLNAGKNTNDQKKMA